MDGKQKISDPQPLPAEVAAKAVAEPPFWEGTIFRIAVLVLLTLLVYLPSFRAGFVWDDDLFVTDNVVIKAGWDGLHDIWFSKKLLAWFPMTATSWWLEWHLWGMNAAGYHVANVLLHAAGAVLLWRVLRQLKLPASWFAALVFAVHPVCVASVSWIAERKNTLSMVFYLLSILYYLRSDNPEIANVKSNASSLELRRSKFLYGFSFLAFALALLSKTSVVTLPFILLLLAWWQRGCLTRRDFLRSLPFFAASFVMGLISIWFENYRTTSEGTPDVLLVRLLAGSRAFWFYLWKLLLPQNLMMIYPRWQINPASLISYLPGVLCLGAFLLFWRFRKTWGRSWLFAFAYFLFALAPVLGVFNINFFIYSQASDHFQYLAAPGMIAFLVAGFQQPFFHSLGKERFNRFLFPFLAAALVILLSILTWQHQKSFRNGEALWSDNLLQNPNSWKVHNGLGAALGEKGKLQAAASEFKVALRLDPHRGDLHHNLALALYRMGRTDEAIGEYLIALQNEPILHTTHHDLGLALAKAGRVDEAVFHFKEAIRQMPAGFSVAEFDLGIALTQQQKPDEAARHLEEALRVQPVYPEAHDRLGLLLDQQGKTSEAIIHYQTAIHQDSNFAGAYCHLADIYSRQAQTQLAEKNYLEALRCTPNFFEAHYGLGVVLLRQQKTADAIAHWRRALQIKPDSLEVLNNLAWLLATSTEAKCRNGQEAVQLAETAYKADQKNLSFSDTLAAAYAEAGRFADAVAASQRAIVLADAARQTNAAIKFRNRLELYRSGKPFYQ